MKHLLLTALLFAGGYCSAQRPPQGLTKQANDSAILAGKAVLGAKITTLQTCFNADPASAASLQATNDVKKALQDEMLLIIYRPYLAVDKTDQTNMNKAMTSLEGSQHNFNIRSKTPAQTHDDLLKYAKEFHGKL